MRGTSFPMPMLPPLSPPEKAVFTDTALSYQRVCVLGLGYVGLPTALLYAQKGFWVQGVDINPTVLADLSREDIPQCYPELSDWWEAVSGTDRFRSGATPEPADVFLITVPTPWDSATRTCDLSAVRAATASLLPVLRPNNLVILESTVPPGTTRTVVQPMLESAGFVVGRDIHLCFSPERILPGNTVHELVHNDRVLGGTTLESALLAKRVLSRVIAGEIYVTSDITAEFCKLAENTFRDVNIALANELADVAHHLGVNLQEALPLINHHPRVTLHQPGIGVGGHCIAVDPWFLVEAAPDKTPLIQAARRVNDARPGQIVERILADVAEPMAMGRRPRVVCAGLTYKPDVADIRESPALKIVEQLGQHPVEVISYDPLLPSYAHESLEALTTGADLLVVLVPHRVLQSTLSDRRHAILAGMRTPRIRVF